MFYHQIDCMNKSSNKNLKFKEYVSRSNIDEYMLWEDFNLTDTHLDNFALEKIKERVILLLCKHYGHFTVGVEMIENTEDYPMFTFPEFEGDVLLHFPQLIQTLSITLKMLGINVPETDIITDTFDKVEDVTNKQKIDNINELETNQTSNSTDEENVNGRNTQNSTNDTKNTGSTISDVEYEREITNTSNIEETGSKNVQLAHNMPEQALTGTGNFSVDEQGTPILSSSYVQSANENFNTTNPMVSSETSRQKDIKNKQTTTNDLNQLSTGNSENIVENISTGTSSNIATGLSTENQKSISEGEGKNIVKEVRTIEKTNPLYAGEISKFLDNVKTINAFNEFIEKFEWLCGVL